MRRKPLKESAVFRHAWVKPQIGAACSGVSDAALPACLL